MKKIIMRVLIILTILYAVCNIFRINISAAAMNAVSHVKSSFQNKSAQSVKSVSTSDGTVKYYFPRDGQAPEPVLVNVINSSKKSLDIAIYSFTDSNIADAVVNAKKRGVAVRVITDRECSSDTSQKKVLSELKSAGIPIKINTFSGLDAY